MRKYFKLFLLLVLALLISHMHSPFRAQANVLADDEMEEFAENFLTSTLEEPVGVQGFYGDYALDDDDELVEIMVQFVTPPAVALRLLEENDISLDDFELALLATSYEHQAQAAHDAFAAQIGDLYLLATFNFGNEAIEILEEYYSLFNGVLMRVPASIVELIADLDEVYGVFPNPTVEPLYSEVNPMQASFVSNPDFMRASRELFNMDYIHHELGITGAGVRVGIIDSGIYHAHPEFARFLDETGRVPGWHRRDNSHVSSRHGTLVAGAAVAMAPNMQMWHYTGGLSAIEHAHADGMDVINMSFGTLAIHPFNSYTYAINLAVLDGIVIVASAGNDGLRGNFTITSPSTIPLTIAVGAGRAGRDLGIGTTGIAYSSSRGPTSLTYHIKPDIIAPGVSVRTTNIGGEYAVVNGTSLAAPIVAGVAALLIEANPDATPLEIKAIIMNTASPVTGMNPNRVFEVGAGFIDPLAALRSHSIVTVSHDIPVSSDYLAPWASATMSSFSFGDVPSLRGDNTSTMTANINNRSDEQRTYSISYEFTYNPNDALRVTLSHDTLSVAANATADFDVTASFADIEAAFYEGYIYIHEVDELVARVPFGLVQPGDTIEGRFPGENGAPWILHTAEGLLEVGAGFIENTGLHSPWLFNRLKINRIVFTGDIIAGESLGALFRNLPNVESIEGLENFDTSNVENMSRMFYGTRSLTSNLGISNWNTSNVTNMAGMFQNSRVLTTLDLSDWNTSKVTSMSSMFRDTNSLISVDLSSWDTSSVTNMNSMFNNSGVATITESTLEWDTSSVIHMSSVFQNASNLASLDLSSWDTSNVINMNFMFAEASSLTTLDLSNFNTSNIIMMGGTFRSTTSLRELTLGPDFSFTGVAPPTLPAIRQTAEFTGMWQNVGTGTVQNPAGEFVLTSAQLSSRFNATMADTWVWQRVPGSIPTFTVTIEGGAIIGQENGVDFDVSTREFAEGAVVTIERIFTLEEYELFSHWELTPELDFTSWDSSTIGNTVTQTRTFVMPASDVRVRAVFDELTDPDPRASLRATVADANDRVQANYTPLSWARMQSMLVSARSVYNNTAATETQINEARNLLSTRLNDLVRR